MKHSSERLSVENSWFHFLDLFRVSKNAAQGGWGRGRNRKYRKAESLQHLICAGEGVLQLVLVRSLAINAPASHDVPCHLVQEGEIKRALFSGSNLQVPYRCDGEVPLPAVPMPCSVHAF